MQSVAFVDYNDPTAAIMTLHDRALSIPQQAQDLFILDEDAFQKSAALLLSIKELRKEIQETFEPMKAKAHSAWKEIVAQEKRHEEPLIEAEKILKPKMAAYHEMIEDKRKKEEEKILKAAEKKGVPAVLPVSTEAQASGISFRLNYKAEVHDLKALATAVAKGKAPSTYILPNMTALNLQAKSLKETMDIPGVKLIVEKTTVGRAS